jgi:hypothetical protein
MSRPCAKVLPAQRERVLKSRSLAFGPAGEVLFLAWGIRVCYNVRNAESLYNEARLITYAIYNIAAVNIAMVAFQ